MQYNEKNVGFRPRQMCVHILILLITLHVVFGVFLNLSEFQFLMLQFLTEGQYLFYRDIGSIEQNSKDSVRSLEDAQ